MSDLCRNVQRPSSAAMWTHPLFQVYQKLCREELCTGNQMACPMCRTEFTIPSSGVGGLPKNFFAADFLQMKELTIRIPKKSAPASHCDQHKDEPLKIYCLGCKVVICAMCYIQLHGGHEWSDVCQVVGEFSKQMRTDAGSITNGVEKCRQILHRLEKEWKVFGNQVDKAGREINEKAQQLERMIGVHRDELNAEQLKKMIYFERDKQVAELSSLQQKRTKEIERVREEIETQLASMESYKECVNELIEKGAACDIVRAANDLHDRANKLLVFDAIERSVVHLGHVGVTFRPESSKHVIGDISRTFGGGRCQRNFMCCFD